MKCLDEIRCRQFSQCGVGIRAGENFIIWPQVHNGVVNTNALDIKETMYAWQVYIEDQREPDKPRRGHHDNSFYVCLGHHNNLFAHWENLAQEEVEFEEQCERWYREELANRRKDVLQRQRDGSDFGSYKLDDS